MPQWAEHVLTYLGTRSPLPAVSRPSGGRSSGRLTRLASCAVRWLVFTLWCFSELVGFGACTLIWAPIFCLALPCCGWLRISPLGKGCTSRFFLVPGLTFFRHPSSVCSRCFCISVPRCIFYSCVSFLYFSCFRDFTWFLYLSLKVPPASPK